MKGFNEISICGRCFFTTNGRVTNEPHPINFKHFGLHANTVFCEVFCDGYDASDLQFIRSVSGRKVPIKITDSNGCVKRGEGVIPKRFKSYRVKGSNNRVAQLEIKIISTLTQD